GHVPMSGEADFRFNYSASELVVTNAEFHTPNSEIAASGVLAPKNSGLQMVFETRELNEYNDFIQALQGPAEDDTVNRAVGGTVKWDGKITGSWAVPQFSGHVRGEHVAYGDLPFDLIEGDLTYSPSLLSFQRGHAKQGTTEANLEAELTLTHWSFLPGNEWKAEVNFE